MIDFNQTLFIMLRNFDEFEICIVVELLVSIVCSLLLQLLLVYVCM